MYNHRLLSGSDNVDKWTQQSLWDAVLHNVRIVTSTPAILLDALSHGFVQMPRIALLIFDEGTNNETTQLSPTANSPQLTDVWEKV